MPATADIEIGKALRRTREDKNLTQFVVAANAGVSLATIQRVEAGFAVTRRVAMRIAKAIKVSLDHLLSLESELSLHTPPGRSGAAGVSSPPQPVSPKPAGA